MQDRLWVGQGNRAAVRRGGASGGEPATVRFLPGFEVEVASSEEAQKLAKELGKVFARFGVEVETSVEPPPDVEEALRRVGLALPPH